ncbi:MAG TPA: hypothetical protein VJ672_15845 [Gemmatimonadaceae bacterium]|nr:hypothetical protein [Gemmatimonadaceae bacterium]
MARILAALIAACGLLAATVAPAEAQAQQWNDSTSRALAERATALRAAQFADTALRDFTAKARGYLTFLGQVGEGFTEPPRVISADELAVEVYWLAPNRSKQIVVGRRDTTLLPNDNRYYNDRFGIVQNNFPDRIRMGDGQDVRDVPHPLSAAGLNQYDFAIRDSLKIRFTDRTIDVIELRVRPKNDNQPRIVGSIFVDRGTSQVVRMAFNFTAAAYIDKRNEDVFVVLENGLVDGRFWLPSRQEIEVRRSGTWLDIPARGMIRGRWDVCCYEVNVGLDPTFFAGREIVHRPRDQQQRYPFEGRLLDSLPSDVRVVTDADVARVQAEAQRLVRSQALSKATGTRLSARRISDFVRSNRVEGLALGAGATIRPGGGTSLAIRGRWGFDDKEAKGRVGLGLRGASGRAVELFAERDYRDAGDVRESSLLLNSIAAPEFGTDRTQPYDVRAAGISAELGTLMGVRWRLEGSYETHYPLAVNDEPALGRFEPTIPAWRLRAGRGMLVLERPTSPGPFGTEIRWTSELRGLLFERRDAPTGADPAYSGRIFASLDIDRPFGAHRLVLRSTAGAVGAVPDVPPQEMLYLGGPMSGPGYQYHAFAGQVAASQRVEWRSPVPFFSVPLGRYGRSPASATLAPFVHGVYVRHPASFWSTREGFYPSAGLGAQFLFDLMRVDVARGLRDGRWTFSIDVTRDFWGIL